MELYVHLSLAYLASLTLFILASLECLFFFFLFCLLYFHDCRITRKKSKIKSITGTSASTAWCGECKYSSGVLLDATDLGGIKYWQHNSGASSIMEILPRKAKKHSECLIRVWSIALLRGGTGIAIFSKDLSDQLLSEGKGAEDSILSEVMSR